MLTSLYYSDTKFPDNIILPNNLEYYFAGTQMD